MTDTITVRGYVATDVRLTSAQSGLAIAGFRMCSTERRFDKEANAWVDGHTNWYSVSMFRQLATHAGASIKKGDRVIVTGRLKVRPWINAEGKTGTSVEIDADTAGHDLMWGTANFRRTTADRGELHSASGPDEQPGPVTADDGPPAGVDASTGELYAPATFDVSGADPGGAASGDAESSDAESRGADGRDDARRGHALDAEGVPF
ncbi:single-stranded DNA-binding protein [Arthrobacter agilis]|uniref:single-stranded DNA-binding protein n=1 Tax=Arthrobacter agilis TaxID=37921 RepID=UPI0027871C18|nr:single-stranded DNA-binding protein [Arthrobacter agilis]MDQ0735128.1 single-strand DNA-binding protein [Arthrobacter agilis]